MTFTVVALSQDRDEIGIATATASLAVGATVPALASSLGAVATQAHTNAGFRSHGLDLLAAGGNPEQVLAALGESDPNFDLRQVVVMTCGGRVAAHTGSGCTSYAGHRTFDDFAVAGNYLAGPEVLEAVHRAWTDGPAEALLRDRLVASLAAGQQAGGDRRGLSSAALQVVAAQGAPARPANATTDLRIDDHPDPIAELRRLCALAARRDGASTPASASG